MPTALLAVKNVAEDHTTRGNLSNNQLKKLDKLIFKQYENLAQNNAHPEDSHSSQSSDTKTAQTKLRRSASTKISNLKQELYKESINDLCQCNIAGKIIEPKERLLSTKRQEALAKVYKKAKESYIGVCQHSCRFNSCNFI